MTNMHVEAGRVLTRTDESGHEFFVISEGRAVVQRGDDVVATLEAGSFFGEMALLDGARRSATVVAATPLDLYVLSKREFHDLLHRSTTVSHNMLRTLSKRPRDAA